MRACGFVWVGVCLLSIELAAAQWPSDPALNLPLGDGPGSQTIPLIAGNPDGSAWVGWFDGSTGEFRVRLQLLSASGVEQFAHGGLVVSDHPQNSALFGWDMTADSSGNAVLVFSDERDGGDLDIHAYRISPAGAFLWGADGLTLSSNPDFEPAPRVTEASDGDFVFVWQRDPSSGDGDVRMQRVAPDGTLRLAAGGLPIVAATGEDPGFVGIIPSSGGDVIVSWLRSIKTFSSPRHIRAQRFTAAGAPVWATHTSVFDAFAVPIGYFPQMRPEPGGGAYFFWHRSDGVWFNALAQRLTSAGVEVWPHNGVVVSTFPTRHHIDPWAAREPSTGDLVLFWNERDSTQGLRGIYGQRLSAAGARLWGDDGKEIRPVDSNVESSPRTILADSKFVLVVTDNPSGSDRVIALALDGTGNVVWGAPPVPVSTASGTRFRLSLDLGPSQMVRVVWEDTRSGDNDAYAQNITAAGTLGGSPPGSVGESALRVDRGSGGANSLRLTWDASCSGGATNYGIYEGTLGIWPSHVRLTCDDTASDRTEEIVGSTHDSYYLVVPLGEDAEGSYGLATAGERPVPAPGDRCLAVQDLAACP